MKRWQLLVMVVSLTLLCALGVWSEEGDGPHAPEPDVVEWVV